MKYCLSCGQPIQGRADKKYCDDTCRSTYNNRLNGSSINLVRNVNRQLSKNRQILSELNPTGKARLPRENLVQRGFNFEYFTSIYETRKGARYFFCYDQGYLLLDNDDVMLVVKQEYASGNPKLSRKRKG